MPDYTGNLNLAKPIPNEDSADIRVINENMDKIDEWSRNIEPAFEKKSGFNKNKSDETNLKDSETLATSMAVAKTMEKAEEALNSAGGKEPAFNKNTAFNKNFGTGQNEILEGSKLAEILGIEYGGVLNNTSTKVAGKGYYDTANKKIYKCTTNTSINYADAGYFIEVSNNDLLGKLQNLITTRFEDTTLGSGGYISFYLSAKSILISLFNVNTPNTAGGDGFYIQIPSWVSDLLPLDITFPFVVSNFGTCAEVFLTKRGIRIYTTQGVALPSVSGSITIPIR